MKFFSVSFLLFISWTAVSGSVVVSNTSGTFFLILFRWKFCVSQISLPFVFPPWVLQTKNKEMNIRKLGQTQNNGNNGKNRNNGNNGKIDSSPNPSDPCPICSLTGDPCCGTCRDWGIPAVRGCVFQ